MPGCRRGCAIKPRQQREHRLVRLVDDDARARAVPASPPARASRAPRRRAIARTARRTSASPRKLRSRARRRGRAAPRRVTVVAASPISVPPTAAAMAAAVRVRSALTAADRARRRRPVVRHRVGGFGVRHTGGRGAARSAPWRRPASPAPCVARQARDHLVGDVQVLVGRDDRRRPGSALKIIA